MKQYASKEARMKFVSAVVGQEAKMNRVEFEKLAVSFGINDKREAKELFEYALTILNRTIIESSLTKEDAYERIVALYEDQANLSLRTSRSMQLQQYSTPAPIAYLLGLYAGLDKGAKALEPSAGNGMLTIAAKKENDVWVNEIDDIRNQILSYSGYAAVTSVDASNDLTKILKRAKGFDAIITNPPFAALDRSEYQEFGEYEIRNLDHLMVIRALEVMKDNGKAAIIIGGHTDWDAKGRIKAGKNMRFLSYLYKNYNVEDVILVNGDLYSKMGTRFDIRLILINGRKPEPSGYAPLKSPSLSKVVDTFPELYKRFLPRFMGKKEESTKKQKTEADLQRERLLAMLNL